MIKKSIFPWLYALCLLTIISSCSDKIKEQDEPNYPGIDNFEGRIREFFLTNETDNFDASDCAIKILTPEKSVISRTCTHSRTNGKSTFKLDTGL